MIVVDTNVIAYLLLDGDQTALSEQVMSVDPEWFAPLLWRSEMRNLLMLYVRRQVLSLSDAKKIMRAAEERIGGREFAITSDQVLDLAAASECSAYDCEFVGLAMQLDVKLLTSDKKVLKAFPSLAISMSEFVGQASKG